MKNFLKKAKTVIVKKKQPLITTALLTCVVVSYQNCQQQEFYEKEALSSISNPSSGNDVPSIPTTPTDPTGGGTLCENGSTTDLICNPLSPPTPTVPGTPTVPTTPPVNARHLGLIANLYEGSNQWNALNLYYKDGYKHPENIYFSNFNIPVRAFDEGFGFSDGEYLKNQKGEKLIEWFAIQANGNITLPASEEAGYFQISTLSDDGIEVIVDGNKIISNSTTHSATVDCAKTLIHLEKGEEKSFQLGYFQGPRYHIALMTFIKRIDDPAAFKASCATSVAGLTTAGFKVIPPEWFTLPDGF